MSQRAQMHPSSFQLIINQHLYFHSSIFGIHYGVLPVILPRILAQIPPAVSAQGIQ